MQVINERLTVRPCLDLAKKCIIKDGVEYFLSGELEIEKRVMKRLALLKLGTIKQLRGWKS